MTAAGGGQGQEEGGGGGSRRTYSITLWFRENLLANS